MRRVLDYPGISSSDRIVCSGLPVFPAVLALHNSEQLCFREESGCLLRQSVASVYGTHLGTSAPEDAKDVPVCVLVGQVGRRGSHDLARQVGCGDLRHCLNRAD